MIKITRMFILSLTEALKPFSMINSPLKIRNYSLQRVVDIIWMLPYGTLWNGRANIKYWSLYARVKLTDAVRQ